MSIGVYALMLVMFMIFCNSIKCGSSACSDVGDIGGFRGVASNDYDYFITIMTIMMNQRQWSKVKSETAGSASVCPFNRGPTKIADPRNGMGCGNAAVAKLTRAQWTFKSKQKEREMILSVVGTNLQIVFLCFDQLIIGNRNELEEN